MFWRAPLLGPVFLCIQKVEHAFREPIRFLFPKAHVPTKGQNVHFNVWVLFELRAGKTIGHHNRVVLGV